jgi:hypothetical protein
MRVLAAVAGRPRLWPTAIRQMRRTAPTRWWARPPFLPLPSRDYLEFRLVTQYGETSRSPVAADVVDYLAWCREWDRTMRR